MEYLMKKGFKFHSDIFKTYSGTNKYYCKDSGAINKALENYRNGLKMYSKIPLALADGMNDGE